MSAAGLASPVVDAWDWLQGAGEDAGDFLLGSSAADVEAAYRGRLYTPQEEAFVNPHYDEWKNYLGDMAAQTLDPALAQGYLKDTYREAMGRGDIASRYGAMADEQAMRAAMQGMAGAPQQNSMLAGLAAGQQAQEQAGAKTAEVAAQEQNAAINQLSQLTSFYLSQGLDLDTASMQAQLQLQMLNAGMAGDVVRFQMGNQPNYDRLIASGLAAGGAGLSMLLQNGGGGDGWDWQATDQGDGNYMMSAWNTDPEALTPNPALP